MFSEEIFPKLLINMQDMISPSASINEIVLLCALLESNKQLSILNLKVGDVLKADRAESFKAIFYLNLTFFKEKIVLDVNKIPPPFFIPVFLSKISKLDVTLASLSAKIAPPSIAIL